jgi:hypothetical protein
MKVSELIEELQKCPQDSIVVLQSDAEGNGYSPLSGVDPECVYEEENGYSGTVYDTTWSADDADMTKAEWKKFKAVTPACVVLHPIN